GANTSPARGTLAAEEVAGLDLRGCELVVLSACETGRGRIANGDGVLGLQRAFHMAGARATLTSLWSISDAATSVLMEQFYQRLWSGKKVTKLEALRQAQLYVLRNPAEVRKRIAQLRVVLVRRGVVEAELESRGLERKAVQLRPGTAPPQRSHPAWWAA